MTDDAPPIPRGLLDLLDETPRQAAEQAAGDDAAPAVQPAAQAQSPAVVQAAPGRATPSAQGGPSGVPSWLAIRVRDIVARYQR